MIPGPPPPPPPPFAHADGKIAAFLEERLNVGVNFVLSAEGALGRWWSR